jgi:phage shock protein PspC (stress-responsive transcriptional regulator)
VTDRLFRSPTDRVIAGVAGGLAVWLNVDPSLVRIAWVLLAIASGGIFVLVYFVMMIVVPLPPPGWVPQPRGTTGVPGWPPSQPGAGAVPGWDPGTGASWDATGSGAGAPSQAGWTPPQGGWAPSPGGPTAAPGGWTAPPGTPSTQPQWVTPKVDSGAAGIVVGAVLVLLGAWFLVDQYLKIDWDLVWPVIVIVLGAVLIVAAMRRSRGPGS